MKTTTVAPGVQQFEEDGLDCFYLVQGAERALLIDTGTGTQNPEELARRWTRLPLLVAITHGHVDHAGGIHAFEEVYTHPADFALSQNVTREDRSDYVRRMMDAGACSMRSGDIFDLHRETTLRSLTDGQTIDLGGRVLACCHTPGHTDGSICLMEEREGLLFSGDSYNTMLLLSDDPEGRSARLRSWLDAAKRCLKQCQPRLLCAGHGLVTPASAQKVLRCGGMALADKIPFVREKRHIFDADFASLEDVCVCLARCLRTEK